MRPAVAIEYDREGRPKLDACGLDAAQQTLENVDYVNEHHTDERFFRLGELLAQFITKFEAKQRG
jgi:hypothetical protein